MNIYLITNKSEIVSLKSSPIQTIPEAIHPRVTEHVKLATKPDQRENIHGDETNVILPHRLSIAKPATLQLRPALQYIVPVIAAFGERGGITPHVGGCQAFTCWKNVHRLF